MNVQIVSEGLAIILYTQRDRQDRPLLVGEEGAPPPTPRGCLWRQGQYLVCVWISQQMNVCCIWVLARLHNVRLQTTPLVCETEPSEI